MPIDIAALLQNNQNQMNALRPTASNATLKFGIPQTGQPIDLLGQLGAVLQSQNNDRIRAEQAKQDKAR